MFTSNFRAVDPDKLTDNFFRVINREWMLVTAGTIQHYNTMTASWGTTGILWNKKIAICFIRPTRYTFEFAEKNDLFTMSFFTEKYQDALNYCGSQSGRNVDKAAETGLKPVETTGRGVSFEQSRLILECRKIYSDLIREEKFIDKRLIDLHYPKKDFHKFFIGEITGCWESKNQ
jgi:flavin reductase (DIM6/NTAB) family NADH-FMN oxidoreductase RutF